MARKNPELEAAEDMLRDAFAMLGALPDRERAWLGAGGRCSLPAPIRDRIMDYADTDAAPRQQLSAHDMDLLGRIFWQPECLTLRLGAQATRLLGTVMLHKLNRAGTGFAWEEVWLAMGGRAQGCTKDTLSARYEGILKRVAAMHDLWAR